MFDLSENQNERKSNFEKIKDQVESIKMILRCGICCSTLRDPIMTTCNHAFCRVCLFECFKRLSSMRCPICNTTLNKRSCASCPLLSSSLEKYLPLAKAFKKDILATDFAKENDFIESQVALFIPMTQAISSPLQLSKNQSQKLARKESKSVKRRITHPQHRPVKMQRIDGADYSNLVTELTSVVAHTFRGGKNAVMFHNATNSSFKQLQMISKKLIDNGKEIGNFGIQTDKKEMQHKSQQIDEEDAACPSLCIEKLKFSASAMHDKEIQKDNNVNRSDASAQMEAIVNSVFEESENQSRIEVLIKCMPWIPNFLNLNREEVVNMMCRTNAEEEYDHENSPSKNGIDLVLESDGEVDVAVPVNISHTVNCSHSNVDQSKGHNIEQNIVSFVKDKQCYKEDNEVCHSMMVSGASKLSDQSLLREFLDNFSSFKLSTSINRQCTYLVIFNANGLICEFWTVKLIYALVNHCTIVSYSWLENCLNQKSILPTDDFEILLKIDETLISIAAQRALTDPSTLFDGHIFYVPQTFFNTQLIARDVFLEIIEMSGGKTVSHVWELPSERGYIIFAPDCFNRDAARRFELDVEKEVLKADWIFASIGQHRILDRGPYRLINAVG
uniref:RING-type E3 ubiquitin transferase BRCA1 n=1 Tax=Elaeophora elaphi TaxID=1147741 RepID=A0A0R3RVH7_9BILA